MTSGMWGWKVNADGIRWMFAASLLLNTALGSFLAYRWYAKRQRPELSAEASAHLHRPARYWFEQMPAQAGSLVFLGDSITAEGAWGELLCRVLNRGVHGDTSLGMLQRADEVLTRHPSVIVVMIGVNDIFQGVAPEEIAGNVGELLQRARSRAPKSRVVVVATLPVREDEVSGAGVNAKIAQLNDGLRREAAAAGQPFIEQLDALLDESGQLRADMTRDGVHLTPAGYLRWLSALEPFVRPASVTW